MARTRLRIIIPLLQVLILILAFSSDPLLSKRFVTRSDLEVAYVITPEHLLLKLNFPLVILGLPVIYFTSFAFPHVSSTTVLGVLIFGVYVLAIVASTALFWYLVVVEVEMRKNKASCLRFSGRLLEGVKAVVLILIGVGAAVYALWDGHDLIVRSRIHSLHWSSLVDALAGGLFLFGWAAVLITIGAQDIARVTALSRGTSRGATPPATAR